MTHRSKHYWAESAGAAEHCAVATQYRVGDPAPPPLKPFTEQELIAMWGGKTEPLVSILCPTYNHREFIADALDGFLGQITDFPFEVIVRDDASTDGTADIVRAYAARYPTVIRPLLESHNTFSQGVSFIPPLAKAVRGSLIALCAGDDYWICSYKLSRQTSAISKSETNVAVHLDGYAIESGRVFKTSILPAELRSDLVPEVLATAPYGIPLPSSWLVRAEAAKLSTPLVPFITNEDNLAWSRLGLVGGSAFVDMHGIVYRVHPGSLWSSQNKYINICKKIDSLLAIAAEQQAAGRDDFARIVIRQAAGRVLDLLESRHSSVSSRLTVTAALMLLKRSVRRWARAKPQSRLRRKDYPSP